MVWAPPALSMPQADLTVHLMTEVVRELNLHTRFAGLSLGGNEGAPSAASTCTWQTGFPLRVSFANGTPEYDSYRYNISRMLADGEGDLLLWVASIGTDIGLPQTKLPTIVLGTPGVRMAQPPTVYIPVGTPGIDHAGPDGSLRQRRIPAPEESRPLATSECRRRPGRHRSRPVNASPAMMIKLTGGKVYDPANNINGEVRDIYVADGRIVAPAPEARIDKEYDVRGRVVMAGAIDPHTHIGGGKVTIARTLMPEDHENDEVAHTALTRAGTGHALPSTMTTGYRYAEMGYTACFEPAMLPANARQAHMEMADTPMIDKGAFVMLGSDDSVLRHDLGQDQTSRRSRTTSPGPCTPRRRSPSRS